MTIIAYEEKYRDDMIFMVLEAKNALGRIPRLNEDLLDIKGNYLDHGDMFWLALDGNDRVIGCIGYHSMEGSDEVRLHRLYVKYSLKRQGIGSELLKTAENCLREHVKRQRMFTWEERNISNPASFIQNMVMRNADHPI